MSRLSRGVATSLLATFSVVLTACAQQGGTPTVVTVVETAPAVQEAEVRRPQPTLPNSPVTAEEVSISGETNSRVVVGGPIPPQATPAQVIKPYMDGIAVLTTPSGNISCGIYAPTSVVYPTGGVRCGISSYNTDKPYGEERIGVAVDTVRIGDGQSHLGASSDPGPYMYMAHGAEDTLLPQVINYGESVYYGTFVCLSEEKGLTCWDSATGAGAFMSRERTDLF